MIPSNEAPPRRVWTPTERAQAVRAFKNRGDKSVKVLARELGVSVPVLYTWVHRAEPDGEPEPPRRKQRTAEPTSITRVVSPPLEAIVIEPAAPALSPDERLELIMLRREVRRLKDALRAGLELESTR